MELVIQLFRYKIDEHDAMKHNKERRQYEINECLNRNLSNPIFKRIHILLENEHDIPYYHTLIENHPEKDKSNFTLFGKQPLYSDLVRYVHSSIENGTIVCIMNSDIFMGSTTIEFIRSELSDNTMISLTRHEFTNEQHSECNELTCNLIYRYYGSHDAFIFKTPVPSNYNYSYVDIPQNIYGAEAVFMKSWVDAGKQLKNLCFDIPIYHMHKDHFYLKQYETIATHELCNVRPTVPPNRPDIQSRMMRMF